MTTSIFAILGLNVSRNLTVPLNKTHDLIEIGVDVEEGDPVILNPESNIIISGRQGSSYANFIRSLIFQGSTTATYVPVVIDGATVPRGSENAYGLADSLGVTSYEGSIAAFTTELEGLAQFYKDGNTLAAPIVFILDSVTALRKTATADEWDNFLAAVENLNPDFGPVVYWVVRSSDLEGDKDILELLDTVITTKVLFGENIPASVAVNLFGYDAHPVLRAASRGETHGKGYAWISTEGDDVIEVQTYLLPKSHTAG